MLRSNKVMKRVAVLVAATSAIMSCTATEINSPTLPSARPVQALHGLSAESQISGLIAGEEIRYRLDGKVESRRALSRVAAQSGLSRLRDQRAAAAISRSLDSSVAAVRTAAKAGRPLLVRGEEVALSLFVASIVRSAERDRLVGTSGVDTLRRGETREISSIARGTPGWPPTEIELFANGKPYGRQTATWQPVDGGWVLAAATASLISNGTIRYSVSAYAVELSVEQSRASEDEQLVDGDLARVECGDGCDEYGRPLCLGPLAVKAAAFAVFSAAEAFMVWACDPTAPSPSATLCDEARANACEAGIGYDIASYNYERCRLGQ